MKKLSLILLFSLGAFSAFAQQRITLDLQQTIALANDSSLEAFRTKNMYLAGYWEYRTYKANRLPSLTLNMTPAQYNRDITKRYDSEQDLDIYRSQQSFYAYGNLAVRQNFDLTGGTFYLDTELGYMRSFGGNKYTQFTSVPVRLGYSQSLVGYNPFRWERRIEPLKYEKVKKEYIYNAERVSEQATTYFFALAMAQAEYDLAKDNAVSTDTLYRIGMQRLKIAAISRADLLTLKLDVVNARNTLQNAASALKRAMFSLASFLNMEKNTDIRVSLPGRPRALTIPVDEALLAAQANNPEFLGLRQEVLEAEQTVDKTKKESRFNASINASVGFNQVAEKFGEAYQEELIRQMIGNIYTECKGFGKNISLTKEQQLALQTEEFMKRRYEFRHNTQIGEVEYRERLSFRFRFNPLDKRALNSIALDAQMEGIPLWDRDISRYIYSNRVPVFNPLEDFLYRLPAWDGKDRIRALAATVPCKNPYWMDLFHRWFLNMVSHWKGSNKKYANSVSPLLVGPQGTRKSTFCRSIMPPSERSYYTDSIDFSRKKDAELYLNRFALINIDEFDQVSSTQQGFLKHLLQKPTANLRKPYGTSVRELRRYASFIGTSNQKDLLTDPTGSRRFICIEVTDPIDTNVTIDYRQLYAQAMHLLYKNERYWLNDEDEAVLRQSNSEFEQISPLEHLFHCNFSSATNEKEGEWMTAMDIFNYLQENTRDKLSINKINWFGRILRKLNIPKKTSTRGTLYHVTKLK